MRRVAAVPASMTGEQGSRGYTPLRGVIVHTFNQGDSHKIIEIFSEEMGRVRLIARGARASRKRFAGILDLFVSLSVQAARGQGLWTLHSADASDLRLGIRQSWEQMSRAGLLCACVRRLAPEHQAAPRMLEILETALNAIAADQVSSACMAYPRLAHVAGFLPDLDVCGGCGVSAPTRAPYGRDALFCRTCAPRAADLTELTLSALHGAPIEDAATATTVENTVVGWIEFHSGKPLRSGTTV